MARGQSAAIARAPFLWPLLKGPSQRFWNRMAVGWDARVDPESEGHLAPLEGACERLPGAPRRALELGTGTGAGAFALARRFPDAEIIGADLSEEMISRARAKVSPDLAGRVRFEIADAASLPYAPGSFDLVCQLNLPLFAETIGGMVAPGGHVVVASSRGSRTPYYTPDSIVERRFRKLGLEIVEFGSAGDGTYVLARRP